MIHQNSKKVEKGDTFYCIPNAKAYEYCLEAIEKGAKTIVGLREIKDFIPPFIEFIPSKNPRKDFALALSTFYKNKQPKYCFAITGTNGKSSVVHFLHQIWQYNNRPNATLGTLGLQTFGSEIKKDLGNLTTQDPEYFYPLLSELKEEKIDFLALEASSHGLDQHRLDGCTFSAAAFTNLSQDHLDYHETMHAYFEAKKRLFTELLPPSKPKIIFADCPYGKRLLKELKNCKTYGKKRSYHFSYDSSFIYIKNVCFPRKNLRISGDIQIENLLCAIGLALSSKLNLKDILDCLPLLKTPRGRLEEVAPHVFVDFAHTPDALHSVLKALRNETKERIILVFGCGGNRDCKKRPIMGEIAHQFCDVVIVTDDNPRFEDPGKIRKHIIEGCPDAFEEGNRELAIKRALSIKGKNDIVIITGRGHEAYQKIRDQEIPFDDKEVVLKHFEKSEEERDDKHYK